MPPGKIEFLEVAPVVEVATIPIAKIRESTTNPRKAFDEAKLAELTDSVRVFGVLQPVLVRPTSDGLYELVAGARRFRAAQRAGLEAIPANVRSLDDQQVLEVQVVENLQRADLSPMEEARGYGLLVRQHGVEVAALAARLGKSETYVYGRLRLCDLPAEVQDLVDQGFLQVAVAQLLTRVPAAMQVEAAEELAAGAEDWQQAASVSEARRIISTRYWLSLEGAPFDATDATLVPEAGACGTCPKRSGAQATLFGEPSTQDHCTDSPCFQRKVAASWARRRTAAAVSGQVVIDTKREAEKAFETTIALDDKCYQDPKNRTYRKLLGKDLNDMPIALVQHAAKAPAGQERVDRKLVHKALRDKIPSLGAQEAKRGADPERASELERARIRALAVEAALPELDEKVSTHLDEAHMLALVICTLLPSVQGRESVLARLQVDLDLLMSKLDHAVLHQHLINEFSVVKLSQIVVHLLAHQSGNPAPRIHHDYSYSWRLVCGVLGIDMAALEKRVKTKRQAPAKVAKVKVAGKAKSTGKRAKAAGGAS